jgi:predicted TIM-barrel fold metal-dependent hydrolase
MDCLIKFVGQDRIMFGTDNPFFPPPPTKGSAAPTIDEHGKSAVQWPSTMKVYKTMQHLDGASQEMILRSNAMRILNLE